MTQKKILFICLNYVLLLFSGVGAWDATASLAKILLLKLIRFEQILLDLVKIEAKFGHK